MNDLEQRLTEHLHRRAAAAVPRPDINALDTVGVYVVSSTPAAARRSRVWLAMGAAAALIALGAIVVARRDAGDAPEAAGQASTVAPHHWLTDNMSFDAQTLAITVDGVAFVIDGAKVDVNTPESRSSSAAGNVASLELEWPEHGVEMRWFVYLDRDDTRWWVDSMATYNGRAEGDWVTFSDVNIGAPLGSAFEGDIDLTASEGGATSRLQVTAMRFQPYLGIGPSGEVLPTTTTTAIPVGLIDQGLTPAPPLAADLPPTGRTWVSQLPLVMAQELITADCMMAQGFAYPVRTSEEWATAGGEWEPGEFLGVRGLVAARRLGYRSSGAAPTEVAVRSLDAPAQAKFWAALMGDNTTPSIPITAPDGSSTDSSISRGGCMGQADQAFDNLTIYQEGFRQQVEEIAQVSESAATMAIDDPRVIDAVAAWRDCVQAATGQTAATPNELARRYALDEGLAGAEEISVAVADATCQVSTDLQTVWYTVLTDYERALMGDQVAVYDDLVRMRQTILDRADEILRQRGITPPSLD